MKKLISLILAAVAVIFSFGGCDGGNKTEKYQGDVDYNFTGLTESQIYDTLLSISTNDDLYAGKTVAINAPFSVIYNFSENRIEKLILISADETVCCEAYYEVRSKDGVYPDIGKSATFVGTFDPAGYIEVNEIIGETGTDTMAYEIDALQMSASELESTVKSYSLSSDLKGKTVRIMGHYTEQGYKFLLGLSETGKSTWNIEVIGEEGVRFPVQTGNLANPVEIIGEFSSYIEDSKEYPCIKVKQVQKVACVFK